MTQKFKLIILAAVVSATTAIMFINLNFKQDIVRGAEYFANFDLSAKLVKKTPIPNPLNLHKAKTTENEEIDYPSTAEEFAYLLEQASGEWQRQRGYYFANQLIGYLGPGQYDGTHPYGYLSERELKRLSEHGDTEASLLYGYAFLQEKQPEQFYRLFKDIIINTEMTLPIGTMGMKFLRDNYRLEQDAKNTGTKIDSKKIYANENTAYAHFLIMKNRHDPMGEQYLKIAGFDAMTKTRQAEITRLADELHREIQSVREQRGFHAYTDEPLDIASSIGISQKELDYLLEKFDMEIPNGSGT